MNRESRWRNITLALGILLINLGLNATFFLPGEMPYRDSIEGGYASMARFYAAHPNPWGWNPTQYCGLPTQFTYLPGLHYLTALLVRLWPLEPDYAWRLIGAAFACLGPVAVFVFVLYFTRSRWSAVAAALVYTFFSPIYDWTGVLDWDRGQVQIPWRLQVLVKYGEAPHTAGLTLLPLALIAVWVAATGRKYWHILIAALLLAAIALTNWVAALALALCCLLLMLAGRGAEDFLPVRVFAAAALAYGLACFWLTPSYIRTVVFNWPVDAFAYKMRQQQVFLLAGLVAGVLLIRLLFRLFPRQRYLCFLVLSTFAFGYMAMIFYWWGLNTIPESRRYALEFEMFFLLALCELLRLGWRSLNPTVNLVATAVVVWALWPAVTDAWLYATRSRDLRPFPKESTMEYQLARWLDNHHPRGRVFATGGLRFRLNSWFPIPQIGGTFESGLGNRIPVHLAYQIRTGIGSRQESEGHDAVPQLRAMGVEYVVVHGPKSKEHWRDFKNWRKFDGVLEKVYSTEEQADAIYRLPFVSPAHLVRPTELPQHPPVHGYWRFLEPYVAALDDTSRPKLKATWRGPSQLAIEGPAPEGMLVSVQVNYDPGWKATQDGRRILIEPDQLGFMLLHPATAPLAHIELRYRGATEQHVTAVLSVLVWFGAFAGLVVRRRATLGSGGTAPREPRPAQDGSL